jgi:(2R)-sulfolactate sulfo-lyase subunit beta
MSIISKDTTFLGYRRENGRVGVRNHVIILPLDDLSNAAAEAVAHNIKGALAIPHPYGRLQFGADLELHFRTLIGAGCNPNVAAVVVIGIEDSWTKKVVDGIADHRQAGDRLRHRGPRRPRHHHARVQGGARIRAVGQREAARALRHLTNCGSPPSAASPTPPPAAAPTPPSATPSTSCTRPATRWCFGETSEITGGEAHRGRPLRTPDVKRRFMFMFNRYQDMINRHKTSDLSDSQPTKGNIAGGLTTIEEKALGNIQKIGKKCTGRRRARQGRDAHHPGLWFMDSSSAAAEMVTLCAASGYAVHFFPTGQGNVIGNPILPVIKICANPRTVRLMSEHIDVDTSGLLQREMTLDQAGDQLLECMLRTANGRLTAAEALGHREFVMTRLYESA